jgi:hypothetical protein
MAAVSPRCCVNVRDTFDTLFSGDALTPMSLAVIVYTLWVNGEAAGQGPGWQVEHRYRAVVEVLDGSPVSEVAVRYGVSRQSVYTWRDWYAARGIDELRDASRRLRTSPSRLSVGRGRGSGLLRLGTAGWFLGGGHPLDFGKLLDGDAVFGDRVIGEQRRASAQATANVSSLSVTAAAHSGGASTPVTNSCR